jgi:hypothetical protein
MSFGTLNLVLASPKSGIVIATDSRRSSRAAFNCGGVKRTHCDDSQKLFRIGPNSAMAIAGFAAGGAHSPLDFKVASVLRRKFGVRGIADVRGTVQGAADWATKALYLALIGVAAVFDPEQLPAPNMQFTATLIGFDKNRVPIITQLNYTGDWKPSGPLNVLAPSYTMQKRSITTTGFTWVTVGIDQVASAILNGSYETTEPIIVSYYEKLRTGTTDDMKLAEMKQLAKAILRETKRLSDFVGGPDQIGVFSPDGRVEWSFPPLPSDRQLLPRTGLTQGFLYGPGGERVAFLGAQDWYFDDFRHPLKEPFAHVFLACEFKNVSVSLDDNYFLRSSFAYVTVKWNGGPFLARGNKYNHCTIELPDRVRLPKGSGLEGCELVRKKKVNFADDTLGLPVKIRSTGCVLKGGIVTAAPGEHRCLAVAGSAKP